MKKQVYRPKLVPTSHQETGIKNLLQSVRLNFDDQGLGKTKQAYDTAGVLMAKGEVNLCLFVTKASLVENIKREIEEDAHQLTVQSIFGSRKNRLNHYRYPECNVLVVSYDTLIGDQTELESLCSSNRVAIFFDESHYIKNSKARRTISALSLAEKCKHTYCFSGTPIPNKLDDIYTQLKITKTIGDQTLSEFKDRFSSVDDIKGLLDGNFTRRQKTELCELAIPEKEIVSVKVKLSVPERRGYLAIETDFIKYLKAEKKKSNIAPIKTVLVRMLRLNQYISNPSLIVDNHIGPKTKIEAAVKLTKKALANGDKVIIWTSFKKNVEILRKELLVYNPLVLTGDSSAIKKSKAAHLFQTSKEHQVVIAIPAAAREGFTLTAANHAIYLDRSYSSLDWLQSQDRIHRISQKKKCFIYTIEAENTIDELVTQLLDNKYNMMTAALGDKHVFKANQSDMTMIMKYFKKRLEK